MFPRGLLRALPGEGQRGSEVRVEGRLGAGLLVLADWLLPVPCGCWLHCVLGSTWLSRWALPPLSLALSLDLSLSFVSVLRTPSRHPVTCIAEACGRAVPPGCGRL